MADKILRIRVWAFVGLVAGFLVAGNLLVRDIASGVLLAILLAAAGWILGAVISARGDGAKLKEAFPKEFWPPVAAAGIWVAVSAFLDISGATIMIGGAIAASAGFLSTLKRK